METWLSYNLQDFLPFSSDVYFGQFRQANSDNYLFIPVAFAAALFILWTAYRKRLVHIGGLLLAGAWITVSLLFIRPLYALINPFGPAAAIAFEVQAVLLFILASTARLKERRSRAGWSLMILAVAYPLFAFISDRGLEQSQIFAIAPDPTAIFMLGFLLQYRDWRASLALPVPLLWCAFSALTLLALESAMALVSATAILVTAASLLATVFSRKKN